MDLATLLVLGMTAAAVALLVGFELHSRSNASGKQKSPQQEADNKGPSGAGL